ILTIERKLITPFFDMLHRGRGLSLLLNMPELCLKTDQARGIKTTEEEIQLYEKFAGLKSDLQALGMEKLPENLAYRFVRFNTIEEVDQAINLAGVHGGKDPNDKRVGVCVSTTQKALDIAHVDLIQNDMPGALFIYDNDKLEPLTKEEIEADKSLNFVAGYGVKAKKGLQLSNAIVATIKMENPGVKRYLTYSL
ncbi:MAG: hypothetical protein NTZ55_04370, partial [Candidatus Roizmanbacteria bacterium]|nr:hypothetical protein [Candidatus Roizmanbacteria bacterium]